MLIYRVPSDFSKARVAVWRELKRLGGLYVQQAVCLLPDRKDIRSTLEKVRLRVDELGGSNIFLTLRDVEPDAQTQFVEGFRSQAAKEYAEIVEECDTKFFRISKNCGDGSTRSKPGTGWRPTAGNSHGRRSPNAK